MPNKNEPLLLRPSGKDYIWGGSRLNDEFEKNIDLTPTGRNVGMFHAPRWTPAMWWAVHSMGRSWQRVLKTHPEYLGERHKGENTLPILIKFIDAQERLVGTGASHRLPMRRSMKAGSLARRKCGMCWMPGRDAKLVYGLKKDCTKEEMRRAIADGTVMKYLQKGAHP